MPTKGKTKTRKAKSTKKGPKLKWWYILPVIAIVAVAGYAIVRYSQASSEAYVKTVDNGGIKSNNPFYKYYKQGFGNLAVAAPGAPVFVDFSREEQRYKYTCAVVRGNFVDKGSRELNIAPSSIYFGIKAPYFINYTEDIRLNDGFNTFCRVNQFNPDKLQPNGAAIISKTGKAFVYRIFLTNTVPQGVKIYKPGLDIYSRTQFTKF